MYLSDLNPSNMLRMGTILHDTYRIDGYIASGGFGNTYKATNIHLTLARCWPSRNFS